MAVHDIYAVTKVFIDLITAGFSHSPGWTGVPNVVPESPESLTTTGISFYLYHSLEKKETSNFPTAGSDRPSVQFLPMGLTLYYQLCANCVSDHGFPAHTEQQMMSIAMKTLHDFPVIDDQTLGYDQAAVLPAHLTGKYNRWYVDMQPIGFTEAVHNWTAGSQPLKFSAYYQVSTVYLAPEDIKSYTGRVLIYGNYVYPGKAPRLTGSQSTISFIIPGETVTRQVKIQPAQAAPGDTIMFYGTGFAADQLILRLINSRWTQLVIADSSWGVIAIGANQLSITIQKTAVNENNLTQVDVLPGMYSAEVISITTLKLPNGLSKEMRNISNQCPFTICPAITAISPVVANLATITGYIFQHPLLAPGDIDIYINDTRMVLYTTGVYGAGQFKIPGPTQLEVNLPADMVPGIWAPLRVLLAGAESAPHWIKI